MTSAKPSVLVAFDLADEIRETLDVLSNEVSLHYVTQPRELSAQLKAIRPEIVFSVKGPKFPAEAHRPIMEFDSVKWVHVGGAGYDHLSPWDSERLIVTNCAGVLAPFLVETAMGALLALNGNFLDFFRQQQQANWRPCEFRSLSEKTLLIVGLGHIGKIMASRAKAFGMRVIAVKRQVADHSAVDAVYPFEQLLDVIGEADVVSIHLRLNEATNGLFGAKVLSRMKPGSILLNTSRGKVLDEQALISALRTGPVGSAYLDVFEQEPLTATSPLWEMPNVFITPHCSDDIVGWHRKFAELFVQNVRRWLQREPLINLV